jgi:hypothetical protein
LRRPLDYYEPPPQKVTAPISIAQLSPSPTTLPSGLPDFCNRVLQRHRTSATRPLGGRSVPISRLTFAPLKSAVSGPSADVAYLTLVKRRHPAPTRQSVAYWATTRQPSS